MCGGKDLDWCFPSDLAGRGDLHRHLVDSSAVQRPCALSPTLRRARGGQGGQTGRGDYRPGTRPRGRAATRARQVGASAPHGHAMPPELGNPETRVTSSLLPPALISGSLNVAMIFLTHDLSSYQRKPANQSLCSISLVMSYCRRRANSSDPCPEEDSEGLAYNFTCIPQLL